MSKKTNATCSICGKEYTMCRSCDKNKPNMAWKLHCDCPEHYKIFQVIHGYTTGVYNDAEAAKKLERIDMSDFDELRDSIKETINKIRSVSKPKVKAAPKVKKTTVKETSDDGVVEHNAVEPAAEIVHHAIPVVSEVGV